MAETDLALCLAALWDNSIDGRLADTRYGSDFDKQEEELCETFLTFLRASDG